MYTNQWWINDTYSFSYHHSIVHYEWHTEVMPESNQEHCWRGLDMFYAFLQLTEFPLSLIFKSSTDMERFRWPASLVSATTGQWMIYILKTLLYIYTHKQKSYNRYHWRRHHSAPAEWNEYGCTGKAEGFWGILLNHSNMSTLRNSNRCRLCPWSRQTMNS